MATIREREIDPAARLHERQVAPTRRTDSSATPSETQAAPQMEPARPSTLEPPARPGGELSEEIPWHAMSIDEVLEQLGSDRERGLTAVRAARHMIQAGPNVVQLSADEKPLPWWRSISWGMPGWPNSRWSRWRR
ncbi:MAG: cation-transporting P-type ATPase [Chloroflexota bacterium]